MMAKQHKIAGLLLIMLGVYVTFYSFTTLEIGTAMRPGSGFFTLVCGLGITILSLLWLISGMRQKPTEETDAFRFWEKGQWIKPLLGICSIILYALMMERLGYILSTALFLAIWEIVVERMKPITTIIFVILGTAGMYVLFEVLLSVPLPNGLLKL